MRSLLCPDIIQSTLCFLPRLLFTPRHQCVIMKLWKNHSVKYVTMNEMCKLMHIHTSQWTRTRHIFRFSRSGKREVDMNHNSDYSVIFCHDPLSQLAIDVASRMKLIHTRTDSPRFDSALRNKGHVRFCNAQIDESLL